MAAGDTGVPRSQEPLPSVGPYSCQGTCGDPRGVGVSYGRGTPVDRCHLTGFGTVGWQENSTEREFFIDSLLVRIHNIVVMIRWTGLAPWDFEFPFPSSLASTFLVYKIIQFIKKDPPF